MGTAGGAIKQPMLLRLAISCAPDAAEWHFLAHFTNRGGLAILVEARASTDEVASFDHTRFTLAESSASCVVSTLHMVTSRVVRNAALLLGVSPLHISSSDVNLTCYSTVDDEAFDSYAVKLIEEIYATSACAVGKVKKDTGFRLPFGLSFAPADLETGDVEVEGDVASATDEDDMLGRREAEDLSCTDSDVEPPPLPPPLAPPPLPPLLAPPPPPAVGAAADSPPVIGLMEYSVAPSSQAFCVVCEKRILKGEWRFDYRKRDSSSLRDQRRLHAACIVGIPFATRVFRGGHRSLLFRRPPRTC